jgi:hypothetical protein
MIIIVLGVTLFLIIASAFFIKSIEEDEFDDR